MHGYPQPACVITLWVVCANKWINAKMKSPMKSPPNESFNIKMGGGGGHWGCRQTGTHCSRQHWLNFPFKLQILSVENKLMLLWMQTGSWLQKGAYECMVVEILLFIGRKHSDTQWTLAPSKCNCLVIFTHFIPHKHLNLSGQVILFFCFCEDHQHSFSHYFI